METPAAAAAATAAPRARSCCTADRRQHAARALHTQTYKQTYYYSRVRNVHRCVGECRSFSEFHECGRFAMSFGVVEIFKFVQFRMSDAIDKCLENIN